MIMLAPEEHAIHFDEAYNDVVLIKIVLFWMEKNLLS